MTGRGDSDWRAEMSADLQEAPIFRKPMYGFVLDPGVPGLLKGGDQMRGPLPGLAVTV